ncbi:PRA1 family protein H-like isoform X1 [Olea europaea var. sylvestris]|uniref:PRA1 family protein H-like isoform X1 n=1 Tax=Olea europaea var. sylvestris TaxID=158386 RepID=UPI000C1D6886|nr:PRA1 family protein H-like isoform X1 [Olea europaea var. sylvestris]XP_022876454.1 PRA1 family protein H-like isoform X1 [Olea europaea var. sylvestris]
MVFKANPLALSVPEQAFESWLRDSGYLEILDQRTSDLHRLSAADCTIELRNSSADSTPTSIICSGFFVSLFSRICTLLSLITFNPFSKLVAEDFSGDTPSWTLAFFGSSDSYSFPSSPSQARLRVHENVKRFARNYALLFVVFFACSLYQLPLALVGLISCLSLWDVFKFCADRWELYKHPSLRQTLLHIAQCATAIILFFFNVQLALVCAIGVSYAVLILHASFRKLTPARQPSKDGNRRIDQR